MVSGISHITLIVRDLNRTSLLLKDVFGAEEVYSSEQQTFSLASEKFFLIAGVWICIMEGDSRNEQSYNHIAFKIEESELDACREKIEKAGLAIEQGRPRVAGEGQSLYFCDWDNHLWELHTGTLEERLQRYKQE